MRALSTTDPEVLRSAMRKLGVQTRAQLVERLREFQALD
jgi:DNA-binding NarL/FixJ family response regulator